MSRLSNLLFGGDADFMSCWCEMKEIALIDTSICSKIERSKFLTCCQQNTFIGHNESGSVHFPIWCWLRKIKLKSIQLTEFNILLYSYFDWSTLKVVKFHNIGASAPYIQAVVNTFYKFQSVEYLCLDGVDCFTNALFYHESMLNVNFSSVTKLKVVGSRFGSNKPVLDKKRLFNKSLSGLTSLVVDLKFINYSEFSLSEALQNNHHLQIIKIALQGDARVVEGLHILTEVTENCPALRVLSLNFLTTLDFDQIRSLFLACPDLQELYLLSTESNELIWKAESQSLSINYLEDHDDSIEKFVSLCQIIPPLKDIELCQTEKMSDEQMITVFTAHQNTLESLKLTVTEGEDINFTSECLKQLLTLCTQLTSLDLYGLDEQGHNDNALLMDVFSVPNTIKHLKLDGMGRLYRLTLSTILSRHKNIRKVTVFPVFGNPQDTQSLMSEEFPGVEFDSAVYTPVITERLM